MVAEATMETAKAATVETAARKATAMETAKVATVETTGVEATTVEAATMLCKRHSSTAKHQQ